MTIQGKAGTKQSVSMYYVKTSKDGSTFNYILDDSGTRPKVKHHLVNKVPIDLDTIACILFFDNIVYP